MSNNRIKVSDLDFTEIRNNLKDFLKSQDTFADYDFDGSALSVLVDLLAYNTHYNAIYTNLAVNEMFLDSASKRSSVISIAHNYGYVPKSSRTPKAIVNVLVTEEGAIDQQKFLDKYSAFTTTYDNAAYTFYTLKDYSAEKNNDEYLFENVELYEGTPDTRIYVCTEENQRFLLPNLDIDTSTIELTVRQTTEEQDYEKYTLANDVLELQEDSKVYFLKELEDETYEVYFGSNGLGKPILPGNVVTVTYLITKRDAANGASNFSYSGNAISGSVVISTQSSAAGGAEPESIPEIKYNVSKSFYDQNRAVTAGDYVSILKRNYADIESISVWGGEENDPPQYGRVFIAIKPQSKPFLTPGDKSFITNSILKNKNIVSINPVIVDPSYIEMELNCAVYYNNNLTTRSSGQMINSVTTAIVNYRDQYLRKFDGIFRMSKFSAAIDAVDQSIQSNITTFKLYSNVFPKFNTTSQYILNLNNPIYSASVPEEAFITNGFYIDTTQRVYYLDDDGNGSIRLYYIVPGTSSKIITNPNIGTIDYSTGKIIVNGLNITNIVENDWYWTIKTSSYDVISNRSQILDIPTSRINVSVIQDASSAGFAPSLTTYKFTTSRN